MGDGCIYNRKQGNYQKMIDIVIHKNDSEILDMFKEEIKTEKLYFISKDNIATLQIVSDRLCDNLISHNILPRKNNNPQPPKNIPDEFKSHFIRALFDSDGCIYKGGDRLCDYEFQFCGSKEIVSYFQSFLKDYDINLKIYQDKRKNKYNNSHYYIRTQVISDLQLIRKLIYDNSQDFKLKRKRKLFDIF